MSGHLLGHGHMDVASPRCRLQFKRQVLVIPAECTTSPCQICIPVLPGPVTPLLMIGTVNYAWSLFLWFKTEALLDLNKQGT